MYRLIIGLTKFFPSNHTLYGSFVTIKTSFRSFSSSATALYLTLGTTFKNDLPDGSNIVDILLFDPIKEDIVTLSDKTIPEELVASRQIGSANGWGIFANEYDNSLRISDIYNTLASDTIIRNPTIIPSPSLAAIHSNSTNIVWNVAITSPCDDKDCVVAIKFLNKQLSLCRPHCDIRWTNLVGAVFLNNFDKFENSNLMYSKIDNRFYLPSPGGITLYSWDCDFKKKSHELSFRDLPELDESEWKTLGWCCRTEHFIESDYSGERFLVKWYMQRFFSLSHEGVNYTTKRFMVFREEKRKCMYYTEDIGDTCIFISKSEAFCVQAGSCPGLKPNSIYFIGHGFGIYNVADNTIHYFQAPEGAPTSFDDPYWLPPTNI